LKKLHVNTEGCIGCGACFAMDPEHFTPNEDGFSTIKSEENIDSEVAQNVVSACPVGVISYEECGCEHCECDSCECNEDEEKAA